MQRPMTVITAVLAGSPDDDDPDDPDDPERCGRPEAEAAPPLPRRSERSWSTPAGMTTSKAPMGLSSTRRPMPLASMGPRRSACGIWVSERRRAGGRREG